MIAPTDEPPEVYVTNFHRRLTGVSATADAVVAGQVSRMNLRLVGNPLPSTPVPCSYVEALRTCRSSPAGRPFAIWHVRRNIEMTSALFARDVLRLPVRIVFTSAAQRLHSAIPRQLISRMDAVVATTKLAGSLVPHLAEVVPHGVDINRFIPAKDRAAAWAANGLGGTYGIGIVGRIRAEKGTDLFVESMCRLLPKHNDFTAVVIGRAMPGDAGFVRALKKRIDETGLNGRVVFVGEQDRGKLPALMRSLSLLVAPARYEGYGMTPLEAMASEVAVVATDTGVYKSIIEQDKSGVVVPLEGIDELTEAISRVIADPDQLHAMGRAARERAVTHLSLENEINSYTNVYERLWAGERF